MEWFYPNWINDMWRIMGYLFFSDKRHFEEPGEKRFNKDSIVGFCMAQGIALYDAATVVRRLKDNASDKFLEIVEQTDISGLLERLPDCRDVVVTGEKAAGIAVEQLGCGMPQAGDYEEFKPHCRELSGRKMRLWRMPSSSRACPLPLEKKAEHYAKVFCPGKTKIL